MDPPYPKTLIKQGAEAHLYLTVFPTRDTPALLKHRPSKSYRHPLLDARLTKHRCLSEARLLIRLRRDLDIARRRAPPSPSPSPADVPTVPAVYFVDEGQGEIFMEWIPGRTVREVLDDALHPQEPQHTGELEVAEHPAVLAGLMVRLGSAVAQMHALDVVHGDLTTSNIMLRPYPPTPSATPAPPAPAAPPTWESDAQGEIVLIDFGLGGVSSSDEDMAVDLYVLERAFGSTHPRAEGVFGEVLRGYAAGWGGEKRGRERGEAVLRRLEEVRGRGRKRSMLG